MLFSLSLLFFFSLSFLCLSLLTSQCPRRRLLRWECIFQRCCLRTRMVANDAHFNRPCNCINSACLTMYVPLHIPPDHPPSSPLPSLPGTFCFHCDLRAFKYISLRLLPTVICIMQMRLGTRSSRCRQCSSRTQCPLSAYGWLHCEKKLCKR